MKYIKLYEDLEFDPNNFRKLRKDIKAITIELKDDGFKIQPFEVENDNDFDNFDFFVKIYKTKGIWGFYFDDIRDYVDTIKDYVDNYYVYKKLSIRLDDKIYNDYYINDNRRITQIEINFDDIKKK
jgi:cytochrome oxidase Cu insertion factor (SCO1/SenC/PrrC family)